jgi:hypothetical protein
MKLVIGATYHQMNDNTHYVECKSELSDSSIYVLDEYKNGVKIRTICASGMDVFEFINYRDRCFK